MFKLLALTISKCTSTAIFLYMIIYNTEVYGQAITLDPNGVEFISSCSSDLKVGDFYIYRAIVDATNGIVANFVDFQIKATTDSDFKDLCLASLLSCATPNPQACYCAVKNGVIYQIVANRSALVRYSEAEIRILWRNNPDVASNNTFTLPKIINVTKDTNTSLTVDGVNYGMNCPSNVIHGSVMTYQCVNSPSPCDLTIAINNTEVANGEHNVTYTVSTNLPFNAEHYFTFSAFVCREPMPPTTCQVTIEDVITTLPTSSTAVPYGTTSTNTGTTVAVPTTHSTTAPLGSNCSLSCEDWAIALSVIFFVAILVLISTGITILVEVKKKEHETVIKRDKKTVAFYLCIGFLVFAEVLDIILIMVFAQANPCKCDPQPGILLALWEIMLIIFCIVNGLLIIATVVVLIWIFVFEKKEHDTGSNGPEITPTTTTNTENTRKPSNHKNNNGQKKHVSLREYLFDTLKVPTVHVGQADDGAEDDELPIDEMTAID